MKYDKKKGELSVYKDGKLIGVCFNGLKKADISPCCDFSEPQSKIEIVKGKYKK